MSERAEVPHPAPPAVIFADVEAAAARIAPWAHTTPVHTSRTLNTHVGAQLHFKCENLQRVGAFKFRGACNALLQLSDNARQQGVLAWSSGNHAQAMALAGRLLDVPTTLVMPADAPAAKLAATRGYGAEVVLYDRRTTVRETLGRKIAKDRGLTIIPPYDHPHVIAGQGTAALELFAAVGPLDMLIVPCGGGGLLSGCAVVARALHPECTVVGVEPETADDATRSFTTGVLHRVHEPPTIADGARTPSLGDHTFPLILNNVDQMVTVPDEALIDAMRWLWSRMKLVVEPTGALPLAAVLQGRLNIAEKRVGIIISGGNVDLGTALGWFQ